MTDLRQTIGIVGGGAVWNASGYQQANDGQTQLAFNTPNAYEPAGSASWMRPFSRHELNSAFVSPSAPDNRGYFGYLTLPRPKEFTNPIVGGVGTSTGGFPASRIQTFASDDHFNNLISFGFFAYSSWTYRLGRVYAGGTYLAPDRNFLEHGKIEIAILSKRPPSAPQDIVNQNSANAVNWTWHTCTIDLSKCNVGFLATDARYLNASTYRVGTRYVTNQTKWVVFDIATVYDAFPNISIINNELNGIASDTYIRGSNLGIKTYRSGRRRDTWYLQGPIIVDVPSSAYIGTSETQRSHINTFLTNVGSAADKASVGNKANERFNLTYKSPSFRTGSTATYTIAGLEDGTAPEPSAVPNAPTAYSQYPANSTYEAAANPYWLGGANAAIPLHRQPISVAFVKPVPQIFHNTNPQDYSYSTSKPTLIPRIGTSGTGHRYSIDTDFKPITTVVEGRRVLDAALSSYRLTTNDGSAIYHGRPVLDPNLPHHVIHAKGSTGASYQYSTRLAHAPNQGRPTITVRMGRPHITAIAGLYSIQYLLGLGPHQSLPFRARHDGTLPKGPRVGSRPTTTVRRGIERISAAATATSYTFEVPPRLSIDLPLSARTTSYTIDLLSFPQVRINRPGVTHKTVITRRTAFNYSVSHPVIAGPATPVQKPSLAATTSTYLAITSHPTGNAVFPAIPTSELGNNRDLVRDQWIQIVNDIDIIWNPFASVTTGNPPMRLTPRSFLDESYTFTTSTGPTNRPSLTVVEENRVRVRADELFVRYDLNEPRASVDGRIVDRHRMQPRNVLLKRTYLVEVGDNDSPADRRLTLFPNRRFPIPFTFWDLIAPAFIPNTIQLRTPVGAGITFLTIYDSRDDLLDLVDSYTDFPITLDGTAGTLLYFRSIAKWDPTVGQAFGIYLTFYSHDFSFTPITELRGYRTKLVRDRFGTVSSRVREQPWLQNIQIITDPDDPILVNTPYEVPLTFDATTSVPVNHQIGSFTVKNILVVPGTPPARFLVQGRDGQADVADSGLRGRLIVEGVMDDIIAPPTTGRYRMNGYEWNLEDAVMISDHRFNVTLARPI